MAVMNSTTVPTEELQQIVSVSVTRTKPTTSTTTTAEVIRNVSTSSCKSVLGRLEEMEKALDHFQQRLKEDQGCINELGFCFPIQQRSSSNHGSSSENELESSANAAFMLDNGNGLLPFIKKCLRNESKYFKVIRWTNQNENEFKIVDPERFAAMYGSEKRKEGMTKRKLTRSLAYLVNSKNRLQRSSSRTFVYKIVSTSINEESRSCETSPSNSCLASPVSTDNSIIDHQESKPFAAHPNNNVQSTVSNSSSRGAMSKLKQMVRDNPQLIETMLSMQNKSKQQQQQQCQGNQVNAPEQDIPTFRMTGSKRNYENIFQYPNTTNDFAFTNTKTLKMELSPPQMDTSFSLDPPFIDTNNNYYTHQQSPSNSESYSTMCSPESTVSSNYENAANYFQPNRLPEMHPSCSVNGGISNSATTFLEQVLDCQQRQTEQQTNTQITTNFINQSIQQSMMLEVPENLASIIPTFCAAGAGSTNTVTVDLSVYLQ